MKNHVENWLYMTAFCSITVSSIAQNIAEPSECGPGMQACYAGLAGLAGLDTQQCIGRAKPEQAGQ
jgi:hypothetical protein